MTPEQAQVQLQRELKTCSNLFQDVTGTTIYVVGVICVIPAAGLVAWVVRFVVRKKVGPTANVANEA